MAKKSPGKLSAFTAADNIAYMKYRNWLSATKEKNITKDEWLKKGKPSINRLPNPAPKMRYSSD